MPVGDRADAASDVTAVPAQARVGAAYDDSDDPELAAYNHYLAWLAANPDRSPSDYPG